MGARSCQRLRPGATREGKRSAPVGSPVGGGWWGDGAGEGQRTRGGLGVLLLALDPLVHLDGTLDAHGVGWDKGLRRARARPQLKREVGRIDLGGGHGTGAEAHAGVLVGVGAGGILRDGERAGRVHHEAVKSWVDDRGRNVGEGRGLSSADEAGNLDALNLRHDEEEGRNEEQCNAPEEADPRLLVALPIGRAGAICVVTNYKGRTNYEKENAELWWRKWQAYIRPGSERRRAHARAAWRRRPRFARPLP